MELAAHIKEADMLGVLMATIANATFNVVVVVVIKNQVWNTHYFLTKMAPMTVTKVAAVISFMLLLHSRNALGTLAKIKVDTDLDMRHNYLDILQLIVIAIATQYI